MSLQKTDGVTELLLDVSISPTDINVEPGGRTKSSTAGNSGESLSMNDDGLET
jgi:hypothetical protein